MSTSTLTAFVALLQKSHLLSAEQLAHVSGELTARFPEAKALARELLRRNWLTAYQINQISHGKTGDLVLGSYVILERLGEGGMGEVFKARHRSMGRTVALKILKKERLVHPDAIRRFHREIQAAARLSHPHIVMAYDADAVGNNHFFVMEYVEGVDLSHLVKKKGPLPVPRACNYILQAALGLQHAHEQGMVHRDIKPHNLLLARDGKTVKVLDMGLARLGEPDQDSAFSALTQDGKVIGTPDYIAPEQARNSHTADIRCDIYSLGCTLYYLLSGQVPFPGGASIMEKLMKHQTEEPIPIQLVAADLPDAVASVVHKMLRRKPEERYQTPTEVVAALQPFAGPLDGDLSPGSTPVIALADVNALTTSIVPSSPRMHLSETGMAPAAPAGSRSRRFLMRGGIAALLLLLAGFGLAATLMLMGRNHSAITAKKDPDRPAEPLPIRDVGSTPTVDTKRTGLERLPDMPIPAFKLPAPPVEGLLGVFGEPRGKLWSPGTSRHAVFTRDRRFIITSSAHEDPTIRLWDANTLQEQGHIPVGGIILNMAVARSSRWMAAVMPDGLVQIFDLQDGSLGKLLTQYRAPGLLGMTFGPGAKLAAGGVREAKLPGLKNIRVWDTQTGTVRRDWKVPHCNFAQIVFAPTGERLCATLYSQANGKPVVQMRVWDIEADKMLCSLDVPGIGAPPMFTPDGEELVLVGSREIRVHDAATGTQRSTAAAAAALAAPAMSSDGKTVAFFAHAAGKNKLHFFDVPSGKVASRAIDVDASLNMLIFTPDGRTVVASRAYRLDVPVTLVDVQTGKQRAGLKGWPGSATTLAFSPNGKHLLLMTPEPALRMWEIATGDEVRPLKGRTGPILFAALVRDERLWAGSVEFDGVKNVNVLRRWDLPGSDPLVLRDSTGAAPCWAYDPQNHLIAYPHQIVEGKGTAIAIKLLQVKSAKERPPLPPLPATAWVSALAFSHDGESLACATWKPGKPTGGKAAILIRDVKTGA
jgi:serine/threonine protein kinase/WD40 repeat protein